MGDLESLKKIVRRFNLEAIGEGRMDVFDELLASNFVNRSAPPGAPNGPESMKSFLGKSLREALSDLRVEILDQVAEGDKVTTRKLITGTHKGPLMGVAPTGKSVAISVIDIVRLENGKYVEHWGINNLLQALTVA